MSESGFNINAQNPKSTAFGIFQFLDTTWASYGCQKTSDPDEQIRCGVAYISARYQNPINAYNFKLKHGWY